MIKLGDRVIDTYGNLGVVVQVVHGYSVEEHGLVQVWQIDKVNMQIIVEHYSYFGWEKILRILKDR